MLCWIRTLSFESVFANNRKERKIETMERDTQLFIFVTFKPFCRVKVFTFESELFIFTFVCSRVLIAHLRKFYFLWTVLHSASQLSFGDASKDSQILSFSDQLSDVWKSGLRSKTWPWYLQHRPRDFTVAELDHNLKILLTTVLNTNESLGWSNSFNWENRQ